MKDIGEKNCTWDTDIASVEESGLGDLGDALAEQASLLVSLPFNLCTALFNTLSFSFPLADLTLYIQIAISKSLHRQYEVLLKIP